MPSLKNVTLTYKLHIGSIMSYNTIARLISVYSKSINMRVALRLLLFCNRGYQELRLWASQCSANGDDPAVAQSLHHTETNINAVVKCKSACMGLYRPGLASSPILSVCMTTYKRRSFRERWCDYAKRKTFEYQN